LNNQDTNTNLKSFIPNLQSHFDFEDIFFNSTETFVHPTSVVGKNVQLQDGVKIGPYCTIVGNVKIGKNTKLFSHVSIGFPAQDVGTPKSLGSIEIGENCNIREFVSIHASKIENDGKTIIGNNCYLMAYSHCAHDVVLEDNVILINNVNLAGHVHIERNAIMMSNAASHQFCKIGKFSCVTPFSATRQDLPPFCMFTGQPTQFSGLNKVGLKRAGFSQENIDNLKHITKLFYQDKILLDEIIKQAEENKASWGSDATVLEFIEFIKNSKRGVSKRSISYGHDLYF